MSTPVQKAAPIRFNQPKQSKMHPVGNLGAFAHEPKRGAFTEHHVKTTVPKVRANATAIDKPDYKPKSMPRKNIRTTEKQVAGPFMGQSDLNSESIGPDLGPTSANTDTAPPAFTQAFANKQTFGNTAKKKKKGTPFFGGGY